MEDFKEYAKQLIQKLEYESTFQRSAVFSSTGGVIWEEPEEEYYQRMLAVGNEYITYLKRKKEDWANKAQKEIDELSTLINEFESKMKEK